MAYRTVSASRSMPRIPAAGSGFTVCFVWDGTRATATGTNLELGSYSATVTVMHQLELLRRVTQRIWPATENDPEPLMRGGFQAVHVSLMLDTVRGDCLAQLSQQWFQQ